MKLPSAFLALLAAMVPAAFAQTDPPPQAADWAALAKRPDWSRTWTPNVTDQFRRINADPEKPGLQ